MIRSMTGFGEGVSESGGIKVSATVKSVNSRFLEVGVRIPEILGTFEHRAVEIVNESISRGKVSLNISMNYATKTDVYNVSFDKPLLENYMKTLSLLEFFSGKISASDIVVLPDVLISSPREDFVEKAKELLENAVRKAMDGLLDMRVREGEAIGEDIRKRLDLVVEFVDEIAKNKDMSREYYLCRLRERIKTLLEGTAPVDEDRILQEAAFLAQKSDPTEEVTRLKSHVQQFRDAMDAQEAVGSKLRFILQECNRETDTIGAKGDTAETSRLVIAIKEQLERIREQVSNVE
jgi:uncharacterized protein (TIGR00255 family)